MLPVERTLCFSRDLFGWFSRERLAHFYFRLTREDERCIDWRDWFFFAGEDELFVCARGLWSCDGVGFADRMNAHPSVREMEERSTLK